MNRLRKALVPIAVLLGLGALSSSACSSCNKDKDDKKDAMAKPDPRPAPQMPAPGTDADNKRVQALALATQIDGALASYKHDEKPMDAGISAQNRKAEAWWVEASPEQPKKLIIKDLDSKGELQSSVEMYFDDKGMLSYAKAPDGHFVFHMEGLALWLDPEQRVKRGVKPQDASARANEIKKDMNAALVLFRIR